MQTTRPLVELLIGCVSKLRYERQGEGGGQGMEQI